MAMTLRTRRAVTALGVLLVIGAPSIWFAAGTPGRSASAFGEDVVTTAPPAEPAPVEAPSAPAEPVTTSDEVPAAAGVSPFTTTAPRGPIDPTSWPALVSVEALGIAAPVQPVGLGEVGELIIPASPMDVGWFQGGSVPGEAGVALLSSHIDTRTEGRGVFAGLTRLVAGDTIRITTADGTEQVWVVIARTQHRKDDLPEELFARSGAPLLALVTCGGPFDQTVRSYRDNVIVWAEPAA
jgi:hypothetical protein